MRLGVVMREGRVTFVVCKSGGFWGRESGTAVEDAWSRDVDKTG